MASDDLVQRISHAKDAIGVAEGELVAALRAMEVHPVGEKVGISDAAADAFDKLRAAKAILGDLEVLLGREGDPVP